MSSYRLSIIIVTYNSRLLIRDCLDALWPQLQPDDEVILVDNASSDGCVDGLTGAYHGLRTVQNAVNRGYPAANNQGLRLARGRYILLLNPDAVLSPGALNTAVTYMDVHTDVGILGPRILLPNGRLDPPARRTFKTPATYVYKLTGLSWLFPRHPRFGRYYLSYLNDEHLTDVDAVVGAFLLIRSSVVRQIGPLDESYFMYCEDEDWCWRVKQAGWRVVYNPDIIVHHRKGSSTRQRPIAMIYCWHRSIFRYHRKNIAPRYPAIVNVPVYGGMLVSLGATLAISGIRRLFERPAASLSPRRHASVRSSNTPSAERS